MKRIQNTGRLKSMSRFSRGPHRFSYPQKHQVDVHCLIFVILSHEKGVFWQGMMVLFEKIGSDSRGYREERIAAFHNGV